MGGMGMGGVHTLTCAMAQHSAVHRTSVSFFFAPQVHYSNSTWSVIFSLIAGIHFNLADFQLAFLLLLFWLAILFWPWLGEFISVSDSVALWVARRWAAIWEWAATWGWAETWGWGMEAAWAATCPAPRQDPDAPRRGWCTCHATRRSAQRRRPRPATERGVAAPHSRTG